MGSLFGGGPKAAPAVTIPPPAPSLADSEGQKRADDEARRIRGEAGRASTFLTLSDTGGASNKRYLGAG